MIQINGCNLPKCVLSENLIVKCGEEKRPDAHFCALHFMTEFADK